MSGKKWSVGPNIKLLVHKFTTNAQERNHCYEKQTMIVPPSSRHLVATTLILFRLCSSETVISAVETHAIHDKDDLDVQEKPAPLPLSVDLNVTKDGEGDVCQLEADGSCSAPISASPTPKCGVYLAMSTLPGTGIGMFAGRDYEEGQDMMELGDHVIPIVDMSIHQRKDIFFLWDDYTWDSDTVRATYEGVKEVNAASPGFGAAANSFMDFVNVDEGHTVRGVVGNLHRSKDPGAGGFTPYHSRKISAHKDIREGQELFVSYGNHWYVGPSFNPKQLRSAEKSRTNSTLF